MNASYVGIAGIAGGENTIINGFTEVRVQSGQSGVQSAGGCLIPAGQLRFDHVFDGGANTPLNSAHPGGVNVALADGSVRFLADDMSLDTLGRLATRDDRLPRNQV
jgi:prepilin-type processing-associated H-X9-DG protein